MRKNAKVKKVTVTVSIPVTASAKFIYELFPKELQKKHSLNSIKKKIESVPNIKNVDYAEFFNKPKVKEWMPYIKIAVQMLYEYGIIFKEKK